MLDETPRSLIGRSVRLLNNDCRTYTYGTVIDVDEQEPRRVIVEWESGYIGGCAMDRGLELEPTAEN